MRQTMRRWRRHLWNDKSLEALARALGVRAKWGTRSIAAFAAGPETQNQNNRCPAHQAIAEMNAAQGMVRIQATTMFSATPQRTAESLLTAPTPIIAPVMVCVVETGTPSSVARKRVIAPPVSAQNPPHGTQFGDLHSHRLDDTPTAEQGSQCHRRLAGEHDPQRYMKLRSALTHGKQQHGNDTHRLLRVVAAMAEAIERGGDELQAAKPAVDLVRSSAEQQVPDQRHEQHGEHKAEQG